jgi:hypothetical protein
MAEERQKFLRATAHETVDVGTGLKGLRDA